MPIGICASPTSLNLIFSRKFSLAYFSNRVSVPFRKISYKLSLSKSRYNTSETSDYDRTRGNEKGRTFVRINRKIKLSCLINTRMAECKGGSRRVGNCHRREILGQRTRIQ